jgi:3',5'-cyclic AMP phosphodiesterase CpdA
MAGAALMATSDLHVGYEQNRELVAGLWPNDPGDWLLVAGDVGEIFAYVEHTLRLLAGRFEQVIWAPGNHELWTHPRDPVRLAGESRYQALVEMCHGIGVLTPEDDFAVWEGRGGPVTVAPLFVLYDYSFRVPGADTKEASLRLAHEAGVVCTDEMLLHPDPHASREAWCRARVEQTERWLAACDPRFGTVLMSHWPLIRRPTDVLRYPLFAQWCGTERTADWHLRFRAEVAVYGHLHIPRTIVHDDVRFEEVSLGYPREWKTRASVPVMRQVFPETPSAVHPGRRSAA